MLQFTIFSFFSILIYNFILTLGKNIFSKLRTGENTDIHSVSIIISLHNEEKNVAPLLRSLAAIDYPKDRLEILLIDDRSTDQTASLIAEHISKTPHIRLIKILKTPDNFGPKKYALETAIKEANGDIILLTDADGRPHPQWVYKMISYFEPDVGMVLGYAPYSVKKPFNSSLYKILSLEYFSIASIAAASTAAGFPLTCVGTNLAYRKTVFEELDGFGQFRSFISGDDDLFLHRVREETDWKISYALDSETHIENDPPHNWQKFYHQRLRFASKGFDYKISQTLTLMGIYFFNLAILLQIILTFVYLEYWLMTLAIIIIKSLSEMRFLKKAAKTLQTSHDWSLLPLASLFHLPYVVYFGAAAQFKSWKWVNND